MVLSQKKIENDLLKLVEKLNYKISKLTQLSKYYSIARLIVFVIGVILFLGFYITNYKSTALLFAATFSLVFIVLIIKHSRVEKSIKKFKVYLKIKKENLARLNLDWNNIPYENELVNIISTDLEQDLNIIERNGLIHLISTGISFESINILRDWLSGKKLNETEIINKQKIIGELKSDTHFRERLLLTSKLSLNKKKVKTEIINWLEEFSDKKGLKLFTYFIFSLCAVNGFLLLGYLVGIFQTYYYQVLLIYIFFYFFGVKYVKDIKEVSEILFEEVRRYSSTFSFIENYNLTSLKHTHQFLSPFFSKKKSPSKILGKINFTIELLNLRGNPIVWVLLIIILPLDYLLALKVEKFVKTIKSDFPIWLNTWFKLEAYCSLATFAYLNPEYQFVKFTKESNLFSAKSLGHPLIPKEARITNDFSLNADNQTNIITGSNMSGKSTFLRTIGINTLLAYSGSVVCAKEFSFSKYSLYSCIKVSDSVIDGISYFYAEVKRLKTIIEQIKNDKVNSLVLVDEIYKGTNNVERLAGSRALIKYLAENGIYSIISTHDLEMVKIADEINSVSNYHFKEIIENNKMSFNYKLTEGACPTTNALKIMDIEGLPT